MAKFELTNKAVEDLLIFGNTHYTSGLKNKRINTTSNYCNAVKTLLINQNWERIITESQKTYSDLELFYRKRTDEPLEITRVLHGQMDLRKRVAE